MNRALILTLAAIAGIMAGLYANARNPNAPAE